ncbi:hypothetical protein D3C80_987190 [compost metagenome]
MPKKRPTRSGTAARAPTHPSGMKGTKLCGWIDGAPQTIKTAKTARSTPINTVWTRAATPTPRRFRLKTRAYMTSMAGFTGMGMIMEA